MSNARRDIPRERIPDELVDAYFDHELDEGSRDRLFRGMLADPERAEELARTQRAVGLLREPIDAPDLTESIMARVERRRRFIHPAQRRTVRHGRLVAAGAVLAVVLGLALTQRYAPQFLELAPRPRPITAVVEAGRAEAEQGARQLASTITSVAARATPVADADPKAAGSARPASASRPMYSLTLQPGALAGVRTLPPAPKREVLVFGGAGSPGVFRFAHGSGVLFGVDRFAVAGRVGVPDWARAIGAPDDAEDPASLAPFPGTILRVPGIDRFVGDVVEENSSGGPPQR